MYGKDEYNTLKVHEALKAAQGILDGLEPEQREMLRALIEKRLMGVSLMQTAQQYNPQFGTVIPLDEATRAAQKGAIQACNGPTGLFGGVFSGLGASSLFGSFLRKL